MQSNFHSVDSGRTLIGRDHVALLGIIRQAFQVSQAAQCKLYISFSLETRHLVFHNDYLAEIKML